MSDSAETHRKRMDDLLAVYVQSWNGGQPVHHSELNLGDLMGLFSHINAILKNYTAAPQNIKDLIWLTEKGIENET